MTNATIYPHATVKNSLERGLEFQDFVAIALAQRGIILQNIASKKYQLQVGENLQGFEIKLDQRCTDTGRLSIEVAEKSSRDVLAWTPSGILRQDNSIVYIQGNYDRFWVFMKNWLVRYHDERKPPIEEFNGTIKRFFLPVEEANKYAGWKWERGSIDGL
jgi:hypothetical protein